MQNPELVKKLIAELKTCTTNDFELHRVEVLEKDLLEGLPVVEVIDDTHQRFNGVTFCKNEHGHYHKNCNLHRTVYAYYYGEIPEGYHIHHKDFNKNNNEIQNLQALTNQDHQKLHANTKIFKEFTCCQCGNKFFAANTNARFCSKKCEGRAYKHSENTQETRQCVICGKIYSTYKYNNTKTCSKECKHILSGKTNAHYEHKKICPICGKIFYTSKHPKTLCCSRACGAKLRQQNHK